METNGDRNAKFVPTAADVERELIRLRRGKELPMKQWTDEEEKELRRRPDTRFGDDE